MPEGDTVWRTAHRLHQVFAGVPLTRCDLRWPGLSTLDFTDAVTSEVVPAGKHLLHRLDSGWTIHSHLRMEGSWRIEDASRPIPASPGLRAALGTASYLALGWRLGMLDVVRTGDEASLVGHLGPDILAADFDAERAVAHLAAAGGPIGGALLDQRNVAGLGTLWTAEALFAARVNPFAEASSIDAGRLLSLLDWARRMMRASCAHGAGRTTYVHGRHHKPCRRCGTLIALGHVGPPTQERVMYYCPRCQGVASPVATP